MTAKRDVTAIIRARRQLLEGAEPEAADAVVLAVTSAAVTVRILGSDDTPIVFHTNDVKALVPGHVVTLHIARRWLTGGSHASGRIESARIDIPRLGLEPLPLEGPYVEDLRVTHHPYDDPDDPYTALWERLTAKPRSTYEFDGIAWGAFPGTDASDNPTLEAVERHEAGDVVGARELLDTTLARDLRCLDAHAHLGNWSFRRSPERAILHYEIGKLIGELSAPESFDGVLSWGGVYNRPFLRCLHGYGLCLWRLDRLDDARRVFERILALNPNDNQGVRFCWSDVRDGRSWKEMDERDRKNERALQRRQATLRRRVQRSLTAVSVTRP